MIKRKLLLFPLSISFYEYIIYSLTSEVPNPHCDVSGPNKRYRWRRTVWRYFVVRLFDGTLDRLKTYSPIITETEEVYAKIMTYDEQKNKMDTMIQTKTMDN